MDRFWFLTKACLGNWLPGNHRGFVGRVWDHWQVDPDQRPRVSHELPGVPYDEDIAGLARASSELLKEPPIALTVDHAEAFLKQVRETAAYRQWELLAVAVMFNHFHIVVGVVG